MASSPAINIRFEHEAQHDVYIAYPCCALATEDDCRVWFQIYDDFFKPLGRRVDCVFVLDMFAVAPCIGEVWRAYRTQLHERYTRFTVRAYMGADHVALMAKASDHQEFAKSVEAAVAMIVKQRKQQLAAG